MKPLRISLRELFLLVALAALGCAWGVERAKLHGKISSLEWELRFQSDLVTLMSGNGSVDASRLVVIEQGAPVEEAK